MAGFIRAVFLGSPQASREQAPREGVAEAVDGLPQVESGGQDQGVDLALVGPQAPGTWLLTFLDAAREVIDSERAAAINAALDALNAAQCGETDFSAFFADLDREPQLPEFLRTQQS